MGRMQIKKEEKKGEGTLGAIPVREENFLITINSLNDVKKGIIFVFSSKDLKNKEEIIKKLTLISQKTGIKFYLLDYEKVNYEEQDILLSEPYNFATEYPLFLIKEKNATFSNLPDEEFWAFLKTNGYTLNIELSTKKYFFDDGLLNIQEIENEMKKYAGIPFLKNDVIKLLGEYIGEKIAKKQNELLFRQILTLSEKEETNLLALWSLGKAIQLGANIKNFPQSEEGFLKFLKKQLQKGEPTTNLAVSYCFFYALPQIKNNPLKDKEISSKIKELIISEQKEPVLLGITLYGGLIEKFGVENVDNDITERVKEIAEKSTDVLLRKSAIAFIGALGIHKKISEYEFDETIEKLLGDENKDIKIATIEMLGNMITQTKENENIALLENDNIKKIVNDLKKSDDEKIKEMAEGLLQLMDEIKKSQKKKG
ncbi:MAG: hypothetical protein QW255_01350 [Candidatus Bilamarchaeaceae archaeon]